jgi:hypothetical protein
MKPVNCRRTEGSKFDSNKEEYSGIFKVAGEGLPIRRLVGILLLRTWYATTGR